MLLKIKQLWLKNKLILLKWNLTNLNKEHGFSFFFLLRWSSVTLDDFMRQTTDIYIFMCAKNKMG